MRIVRFSTRGSRSGRERGEGRGGQGRAGEGRGGFWEIENGKQKIVNGKQKTETEMKGKKR